MGIRYKTSHILYLALLLSTLQVYAQEKDTSETLEPQAETVATSEIAKPAADKPVNLSPPKISELTCPEIKGVSPLLSLSVKAKIKDDYQTLRMGCIDLAESDTLLSESNQTGLEQAAEYILSSKHFIRAYIDLENAQTKDQRLLKRFRTKAFAVRNFLTQKGVYLHLKANREGVFPSRFVKDEPKKVKKVVKVAKKLPPKPKVKTPPPTMDHTFVIDRKETFANKDDLENYGNHQSLGGFQFIPMQSVYFPQDEFKLSSRAQSTLLAMVEYILNHPETNKLIIQSHTDSLGSSNYNLKLADRRALAVRDFMLEHGVPEEIIEVVSLGEFRPVDENWPAKRTHVGFPTTRADHQQFAVFSPRECWPAVIHIG